MTAPAHLALAIAVAASAPRVEVRPERPLVEDAGWARYLNFDFVAENPTDEPLVLDLIQVSALDARGAVASRKALQANGSSPGIGTLNTRLLPARDWVVIFNPFHTWDPGIPLDRLIYEMSFTAERDASVRVRVRLEVVPRRWAPRTALVPPLKGRFVVSDGHDFYAHHRRWDLAHPASREVGLHHNVDRYAYDLSVADAEGRMFRTNGEDPEDWYGFGAMLYAPGPGTVVEAEDTRPDRGPEKVDWNRFRLDPRVADGNYVVIDHGHGEWSSLLHLKQGSLRVKLGQRVRRDEPIGRMGFSGDAITVHVHYRLQSGLGFDVEGLPSLFSDFRRVRGSRMVGGARAILETGDILER